MFTFGFCPRFVGDGGDLQIIILLGNECSLGGVDTQTVLAGKTFTT